MSIDLRAGPPLQRQAARTIFEKSVPGRRAFSCPDDRSLTISRLPS